MSNAQIQFIFEYVISRATNKLSLTFCEEGNNLDEEK